MLASATQRVQPNRITTVGDIYDGKATKGIAGNCSEHGRARLVSQSSCFGLMRVQAVALVAQLAVGNCYLACAEVRRMGAAA